MESKVSPQTRTLKMDVNRTDVFGHTRSLIHISPRSEVVERAQKQVLQVEQIV